MNVKDKAIIMFKLTLNMITQNWRQYWKRFYLNIFKFWKKAFKWWMEMPSWTKYLIVLFNGADTGESSQPVLLR